MKQQNIGLCIDVMYVSGITFLVTIAKNLQFRTVTYIPNRTPDEFYKALDATFRIYNHGGFQVTTVHCDPEFKPLEDPLIDLDIKLNYASAKEHIPEVERAIRTIKERF